MDNLKKVGGIIAGYQLGRFFVDAAVGAKDFNKSLIALDTQLSRLGMSAQPMILALQQATHAQVSQRDLIGATNRAIALLGEESVPRFAELAEVAAKAAQVMGISVRQSFDDIVTGIGRQSRLILDNLGLIVSVEEANINYAEAIGKTVDQLTDADKKQAFLNETLSQARDKYKDITIQADEVATFTAKWADMKVTIGNALLPVLEDLAVKVSDVMTEFNKLSPEAQKSSVQITAVATAAILAVPWLNQLWQLANKIKGIAASPIILTVVVAYSYVSALDKLQEWYRKTFPSQKDKSIKEGLDALNKISQNPEDTPAVLRLEELLRRRDLIEQGLGLPGDSIDNINKQIRVIIDSTKKLTEEIAGGDGGGGGAGAGGGDNLVSAVKELNVELDNEAKAFDIAYEKGNLLINQATPMHDAFMKVGDAVRWISDNFMKLYESQPSIIFDRLKTADNIQNFGDISPEEWSGLGVKPIRVDDEEKQKELDIKLNIPQIAAQFSMAIAQAFKSNDVSSALSGIFQAGGGALQSLSTMTGALGAGAASLGPWGVGLSLVGGLIGAFGGGGNRLPNISKPVDVRLVEITGEAETKLLGIERRRRIAQAGIANNFQPELRLLPT